MDELKTLLENAFGSHKELVTETFVSDLKTLFETAVDTKVKLMEAQIEEKIKTDHLNEVNEFKDFIVGTMDQYLNEAVKQFCFEHEKEVENAIKTEVLESVVVGIIKTLKENGIGIDVQNIDGMKALQKKLDEANKELNAVMEEKLALETKILKEETDRVFKDETTDLTENQRESMLKLMEDMEYPDASIFKKKVQALKTYIQSGNVVVEDRGVQKTDPAKKDDADLIYR